MWHKNILRWFLLLYNFAHSVIDLMDFFSWTRVRCDGWWIINLYNFLQAQALAWLGMSIVAILSYYCYIDFINIGANFGSVLQVTIFHMYFRGMTD